MFHPSACVAVQFGTTRCRKSISRQAHVLLQNSPELISPTKSMSAITDGTPSFEKDNLCSLLVPIPSLMAAELEKTP
jgi:hypothetical protein